MRIDSHEHAAYRAALLAIGTRELTEHERAALDWQAGCGHGVHECQECAA